MGTVTITRTDPIEWGLVCTVQEGVTTTTHSLKSYDDIKKAAAKLGIPEENIIIPEELREGLGLEKSVPLLKIAEEETPTEPEPILNQGSGEEAEDPVPGSDSIDDEEAELVVTPEGEALLEKTLGETETETPDPKDVPNAEKEDEKPVDASEDTEEPNTEAKPDTKEKKVAKKPRNQRKRNK